MTLGSAVRHVSAGRHVTKCATRPSQTIIYQAELKNDSVKKVFKGETGL